MRDRSSGMMLPLYRHEGRLYVAGEPHHEYELRIRNYSGGRLLAVGSVDGVNVLSGETASPEQGGYVLDAYGSVSIAGWRKSLQRIAAFYFTALPDSYAARTGRPDDVGVIGVALFRERAPCCMQIQERSFTLKCPLQCLRHRQRHPARPATAWPRRRRRQRSGSAPAMAAANTPPPTRPASSATAARRTK